MTTYRVIDGYGNEIADGIQDERQARRRADAWVAQNPDGVAVVYDRSTVCTEECVGEECEHEVYRADGRSARPEPEWWQRIVSSVHVLGGEWRVKGTRVAVFVVLDYIAAGETVDQIVETFPQVTAEDVRACVLFGAAVVRHGQPLRGGPLRAGLVSDAPAEIAAQFPIDEEDRT